MQICRRYLLLLFLFSWSVSVTETQKLRNLGTLFFYSNKWSSTILRGTMMSHLMKELSSQKFVQMHSREVELNPHGKNFKPLRHIRGLQYRIISGNFTFCILVKCNDLLPVWITELIRTCHSAGLIVIWDILDHQQILENPAQFLTALSLKPDYWIVTNTGAQKMLALQGIDTSTIWLIPHHHTNFALDSDFRKACSTRSQKISEPTSPIRVCTHANPANQMSAQESSKLSMQFNQVGSGRYIFEEIPMLSAVKDHTRLWGQQRLHDSLSSCDIAIIWNSSQAMFRPNTRLATWWSHGIPAVYYAGYTAYSDQCHLTTNPPFCLEFGIQTFDQIVSKVQQLSSMPALYQKYCEIILQASFELSPQCIADKYLNHLLEVNHEIPGPTEFPDGLSD